MAQVKRLGALSLIMYDETFYLSLEESYYRSV